jgi:hypothetical protein
MYLTIKIIQKNSLPPKGSNNCHVRTTKTEKIASNNK